jgi:hypothetical protein
MLETLLGGLMGGVFRMVPEFLKWLDRASERKHELAMQDKALDFERLRGASRMAEIGASAQAAWDEGALAALKSSVEAQGRRSGIRWVDALSLTVRPVITYWFMLLYCSVKIAGFITAIRGGVDWLTAIPLMWSSDDMAIWAGLLNFWFLGRVFEKAGK